MGNHSEKPSLHFGDRNNADYEAWVSVRSGEDTFHSAPLDLRFYASNAGLDALGDPWNNPEVLCRVFRHFPSFSGQKRGRRLVGKMQNIRIISTETTVPNWIVVEEEKLKT